MKKILIIVMITISTEVLFTSQYPYKIASQRYIITTMRADLVSNKACAARGLTPLHRAVLFKEHAKINEILNDKNIDINAISTKFMTALYMAAAIDDIVSVELLIEKKADPFINDLYTLKPYNIAQSNQIKDMLKEYEEEYFNKNKSDTPELDNNTHDNDDDENSYSSKSYSSYSKSNSNSSNSDSDYY